MVKITLQGQVSRIFKGRRNDILTMYIRGRRINFPQVVFTGKARELLEGFAEGDFVKITGSLKTRGERQESGRILHTQFIKGTDITLVDEPEEGAFPYVNEAILDGQIMRSSADHGMVTLLVRPDDEKFNVWVFKYDSDADKALEELKPDSKISAKCEVQTVRKEISGEVKFFENVVIKDINVR